MIQTIAVVIILICSVIYAIRRIMAAFSKSDSQCEGCPLKDMRQGKNADASAPCTHASHYRCPGQRTRDGGKRRK